MIEAAIAWQVYQISGSALQLGLLGAARFLPALGLSLVGGAVADSYNRRTVLLAAECVPLLVSTALFAATLRGVTSTPLIYGLVLLLGLAAAFEGPARSALLPQLVPARVFANAVTTASTIGQLGVIAGPSIGGAMIAWSGVGAAYALHIALIGGSLIALLSLHPPLVMRGRSAMSLAAIKEGVRFVRRHEVLLGAMVLDMFAVIFGGATALLPIYAADILDVGAGGYGLLTSAQAAGTFAMSVVLVTLPPIQRTGRALLLAVVAFGLATILFGLSRNFALSVFALALTGVADEVSMVMRHTTIQLATPDELRGRVSSVNSIFVGASNEVGMLESGLVATVAGATFAVVSGGIGCIAVAAFVAGRMRGLARYRIQTGSPAAPALATTEPAG